MLPLLFRFKCVSASNSTEVDNVYYDYALQLTVVKTGSATVPAISSKSVSGLATKKTDLETGEDLKDHWMFL